MLKLGVCTQCAGPTAGSATQVPDSVYRALAAAGVTLLSIVASLVVPASLGAFRVAVFGAGTLHQILALIPITIPIPN